MKKLLLIFGLIIPLIVLSKGKNKINLPYDSINNVIVYDTIISCSLNKDKLHTIANEWIALNYKDSKSVIQMNDKEAGVIIAKGIYGDIVYGISSIDVKHTLTLRFKDNKVRITISNLEEPNLNKPLELMYLPFKDSKGFWFSAKQLERIEIDVLKRMKYTINGVCESINKYNSNDSW